MRNVVVLAEFRVSLGVKICELPDLFESALEGEFVLVGKVVNLLLNLRLLCVCVVPGVVQARWDTYINSILRSTCSRFSATL